MDSKLKIIPVVLVLALFTLGLSSVSKAQQTNWSSSLMVIANNIGTSKLTPVYVKSTFKGNYSLWSNGESVTIVLPSSKSAQAVDFASNVMGMSVSGMQKYWLSLVFQGRSNPPVFFESTNEIIQYVAKTSGAIAAIPANTEGVPNYLIIKIQN